MGSIVVDNILLLLINDLGIILTADLSFNAHISKIYGKSLRVLDLEFIKHSCLDFNDSLCIKILYCSLIKTPLEFDSVL